MITIISPATTMNFDKNLNISLNSSDPYFAKETNMLINILKSLSKNEISYLMNLSDELTNLNLDRYKLLNTYKSSYLQAILAFDGQVFDCINVDDFDYDDFEFANNNLRILSGLYGILKPLDLIQAHRLEMKSKLKNESGNDLYKFWKEKITSYLFNELNNSNGKTLVNLASHEYTKAIDIKSLNKDFNIINVEFKDFRENINSYKVIGIYSKKARGHLTRYIIKNKINDFNILKNFTYDGYKFNIDFSDNNNFIFTR